MKRTRSMKRHLNFFDIVQFSTPAFEKNGLSDHIV